MHGLIAPSSWANTSMRKAINVGVGPWFCLFVDGQFRASAEVGKCLVYLGFKNAAHIADREKDARVLANQAKRWRVGLIHRQEVDELLTHLQQKYARSFESLPLIVANRLASENPCTVASAACLDGVGADYAAMRGAVLDYARRVIRP